ncbi:hypothetical protein GALL_426430 [mine drainage metagenome]|uniref:Uncharacterized protein n=1 Tax=mine drainage metagenome TaxID=410659 RepID=A0A1J5QI60_9ZZZZ
MGAGIEPGVAASESLHLQAALLQIDAVDVGDLQFAARRGLEAGGDVEHLLVVEIQSGDGMAALRSGRFFFQAHGASLRIELDHAVALGVVHVIGEHGGAALPGVGLLHLMLEVVAPEQVVAQHQAARRVADEVAADDEGLGQPVGAGLHRVVQVESPLAAVTQQLGESRRVLRGGNDEDVAHAGKHQRRQRVVDHRLVVHRQQLLADRLRDRVEPRAGTAGEDEAFALHGGGELRAH